MCLYTEWRTSVQRHPWRGQCRTSPDVVLWRWSLRRDPSCGHQWSWPSCPSRTWCSPRSYRSRGWDGSCRWLWRVGLGIGWCDRRGWRSLGRPLAQPRLSSLCRVCTINNIFINFIIQQSVLNCYKWLLGPPLWWCGEQRNDLSRRR